MLRSTPTQPTHRQLVVQYRRSRSSKWPSPPHYVASRCDIFVGNRVSLTDKDLQYRIGLIVRVTPRTASLNCNDRK